MSNVLHDIYRPKHWDDVIGQGAAVKVLTRLIANRESHSYLFTGPSGTGKTTLARIAALELGCRPQDIMEIPAASFTGVDDMRRVQEAVQYKPFGASVRSIILDEVHRLSGNAWDSLLKIMEEPPAHVFWLLCTTNPAKVPATIKTRCVSVMLKALAEKELGILYDIVCDAEKIDLPGDVGDMIIREAHGSARQLLVNLAACREVETKKEAAELLRVALESDPIIALCRYLADSKGSWAKAMILYGKLEDENPEGVRIIVQNYFAKACRGASSERSAAHFLTIMDAFSDTYNEAEKSAPLLRSIGRVIFSAE